MNLNKETNNDFIVENTEKNFNYEDYNVSERQLGMVHTSNIITGTVGAIIGSLLGVALWMVIYHLGYISAIAGFAIIFCALKGYAVLGGMLDKKGVIIVVLISIGMVFAANHLSWTFEFFMELKDDYRLNFMDTLKIMPEFLKDSEMRTQYISDLAFGYLFTVLGGASLIANQFRRQG